MALISDILMASGAFGAAIYCFVLSGRLKKFTTLENGMGNAIAVLSAQVDDMTKALDRARTAASGSANTLESMTSRAEAAAARMELLLASMHDLPEAEPRATGSLPDDVEAEGEKKLRFIRRRPGRMEAAE